MYDLVIKNALIINRGKSLVGDLAVKNGFIEKVAPVIDSVSTEVVDGSGCWLIPGIIDDQVHFREPGLTHKANIASESAAAAAGGVTSFMEMPNTNPPATTLELLEKKYDIAASTSTVNYSFFMGASNDNLEEVLKTPRDKVCGIKVFMGSSTGNMLVDDRMVLDALFSKCSMLIATHCEDEATIRANQEFFEKKYGKANLTAVHHPLIRSREGCLLSSEMAVDLAKKYGTNLHVLHISTAEETLLFDKKSDNPHKHITAEACVHHLYFSDSSYPTLGNRIKCNPAIKSSSDRKAILQAVIDGRIDVIATDHAPHTNEEKELPYGQSPSGLPLVQHSLNIMLSFVQGGKISAEFMVEKMSHSVADLFSIKDRGYLDEGCHADIVLVDPNQKWKIAKDNIFYKCGWSPLEGQSFKGRAIQTWVNGVSVFKDGKLTGARVGERLTFER
ncbi:MAG: dihydroorotase [Saprospirales bacterium]|nr:MAG: dihydroorotase [Saprospirales bacterium]